MSSAVIGNLRVNLGLDTAQFDAGARKAQGSLAGLSGSLRGLAMGAAAGAAAALGTLTVAVGKSLNRMDELGKAAQKVGIPVDEFSKLEYAARLSDISLESLTGTLAKFSRSLSEIAAGGQNGAGDALRQLGISAVDAQGQLRPTSAILEDVAAKFATMKDGADKTALAIALFGKSGAEMIPLLNGGRDAIAGAGAELERFGGVVTPQAAQAAEQFNDNLTRLKEAGAGVATTIAGNLAPAMAQITDEFVQWASTGDAARTLWEGINWVLQQGLQFMYETIAVWKSFTAYVYGAADAFSALASGDLDAASAALKRAGEESAKAWEDATKRFLSYKATLDAAGGLGAPGKGSLPGTMEDVIAGKAKPPAGGGSRTISNSATSTSPLAAPVIPPGTIDDIYGAGKAMQTLATDTQTANTAVTGLNSSFADGLVSSLIDAVTGAKSLGEMFDNLKKVALDALQSIAKQLVQSGLNALLGKIGGGLLGGSSFGGFYAAGGTLGAGQWGIAGEQGPEIIHGPARITPMEASGRGGNTNVTVNIQAQDAASFQRSQTQVASMITRAVARGQRNM